MKKENKLILLLPYFNFHCDVFLFNRILNVIFARESTTNNVNTDVTWNIQENNDSDIES